MFLKDGEETIVVKKKDWEAMTAFYSSRKKCEEFKVNGVS